MSNFRPFTHRSDSPRSPRGFALLITITLLAFLVLLLVSLAALTRVETQVADNNQQIAQARQNALLALNIALGQLQKHTGPDRRVTARADVLLPPDVSSSITAATTGAAARTLLEAYWKGARNRNWTGAWSNANTTTYERDDPAAFNPRPSPPVWLVSGNETTAAFAPGDVISDLVPSSTPLDELKDANGRAHRLLVKAGADPSGAATLLDAVTAPQVTIESTAVPGVSGSVPIGHYAWWVGDEGVKARANLIDAYAGDDTDVGKLRRRAVAQRPAIEAIGTSGTDGLAPFYPANHAGLADMLSFPQLALLPANETYRERLKTRFHDLTTTSRGVLSDVKHGGLKRDLSYILGQPDIPSFRAALTAAYGGAPAAPEPTYNPALSASTTPYATLPENPSGTTLTYDGPFGVLTHSATWEQLWSFHNMGNLTTDTPPGAYNAAGDAVVPRLQTAIQHGAYPLLIQAKLFYRVRIVGGTPDADGVNRDGDIWVDVIPLAVIANPYAVPLAAGDYTLQFTGVQPLLRFGVATPAGGTPAEDEFPIIDGLPNTSSGKKSEKVRNLSNGYTGDIRLVLRTTGLAPGQAQVFTIDPRSEENPTIDGDERITITSETDDREVVLTNDFSPAPPSLTYNFSANTKATTKRIPADKTHVALYCGASQLNAALYIDYDAAEGHRRLIHYVRGQGSAADANFFLVDPLSDGIQQGGGFMMVLNDAATSTNTADPKGPPQQAPFYQVNYRGIFLTFSGSDQTSHPVEWARTQAKRGGTAGHGTSPNPFIEANLLYPSGDPRTVRWGLVNIGEGPNQTIPPASIGGPSAGDVGYETLLYDLPTPGVPIAGHGQLQHFNTTGHIEATNLDQSAYHRHTHVVHSWQVNYPIANSYPHPRVPRDQVFNYTQGMGYHYDGSYLWNDLLWDRFYFSTYPASGTFDLATDTLVNARYRPFRDPGAVPLDAPSRFRGDGDPATPANSRLAAQNLLVDGAFNINSTSFDAWKALFSGLRNVPLGGETTPADLTAPFARTLHQTGGAPGSKTGDSVNAWTGIRNLTFDEINALADEMVLQVRRRGPFLSLAEFVNRRLVSSTSSTEDPAFGLSGALQAALDRVINQPGNIALPFRLTSDTAAKTSQLADMDYVMPTALGGFPGYLLQGDVLSVLGPTLAARSDTFIIRTYGDAVNPVTGDVTGRAWCEAVVQRTPDYVIAKNGAAGDEPHEDATDPTNVEFGRRYHVVGFRWLGPNDL